VGIIDLRYLDLDPDDDVGAGTDDFSRTDEFGRELQRRTEKHETDEAPTLVGHARVPRWLRDAALVLAGAVLALLSIWAIVFAGELFTAREVGFLMHLAFGIVIVHFFAGGLASLIGRRASTAKELTRVLTAVGMAVVSWLTVLSGTWMVYPGYRAEPPEGTVDVQAYPKFALEQDGLYFWHDFGMEWKEHVGWITPFLATAVAFVVLRYGHLVTSQPRIRRAVTTLFVVAFLAAVVAAGLGAAINTVAPNDFLDVGANGATSGRG
jgi:hypothetical protein